jgi:hypothetical protein
MEKGESVVESRTYLGFFSVSQFLLKAMVPSSPSCSSCSFCASVNLLEKVDDSAPTMTLVGKEFLVKSVCSSVHTK